jgi:hypothetical protein
MPTASWLLVDIVCVHLCSYSDQDESTLLYVRFLVGRSNRHIVDGPTGVPAEKDPQPELANGEFTIMVTKPGSMPAMVKVTEATTVGEVKAQAIPQLDLTGYEFDFKIAGKKLDDSATMASLGFNNPGPDFPGPVGNIIVRVKNP